MNILSVALIAALLAVCCTVSAQTIRINEVSPANASLIDEDGDLSDWIELYNSGSAPVQLGGYRISDRPDISKAWELPDTVLPAGGYLLVYASGKDRTTSGRIVIEGSGYGINPWNTRDHFRYLYTPVEGDFTMSVRLHSLEHSSAFARIGLMFCDTIGTDNRHTAFFMTGRNLLTFSQRSVRLQAPEWQKEYYRQMQYPHIWIRLERRNRQMFLYTSQFGRKWDLLDSSQFLSDMVKGYAGIAIASFVPDKKARAVISDISINNEQAHLYNFRVAELATDIAGVHYQMRELHTDFKLSSEGETLYLWNTKGSIVDSLLCEKVEPDISCSYSLQHNAVVCFVAPTPGYANSEGKLRLHSVLHCNPPGGFFDEPAFVHITAEASSTDIRYTLDGSIPTAVSPQYTGSPLLITTSCIVRVRAFEEGKLSYGTLTETYLINEPSTSLPVISVVSNPENFWSDSSGIMALGPDAAPTPPYSGANFWKEWEIAGTLQWFEHNSMEFSAPAGIKVQGNGSRVFPQKSLRFAFRDRYGTGKLSYPLFTSGQTNEFENLILRNGGNDWTRAHIRDPLMAEISRKLRLNVPAYRPMRSYINGVYWGLYTLCERMDEAYIADYYGVTTESVDILENKWSIREGSSTAYEEFIDSLALRTMDSDDDEQFVLKHVDIDNFIDYNCAEIFAGNSDWPGNNVRFWRSTELDGRWRWLLFDLDAGFGFGDDYSFNTLSFAASSQQSRWTNPAWSTFLLRRILMQTSFRNQFINRFADLLNREFASSTVTVLIDSLAVAIAPEVLLHQKRWETSLVYWEDEIEKLRVFAQKRPSFVRRHIVEHFSLPGTVEVSLDAQGGGRVRINTLLPRTMPFQGIYFQDVPVVVSAVPAPGYRFVRWSDSSLPDTSVVEITFRDSAYSLTAVFEKAGTNGGIVINEIMYKPSDERDSKDWIELYNSSSSAVDLGGWILKDEEDDHLFTIASGTVIPAAGFLVLCNDTKAFAGVYGTVPSPVVGDVDFGFGTPVDQVRLYSSEGELADSVEYGSSAPWPSEASGTGRSIELLHASLDNTVGGNWRASVQGGTPGVQNGPDTSVPGAPDTLFSLECYPNPVSAGVPLLVRCRLKVKGRLVFTVADVSGRVVAVLLQSADDTNSSMQVVDTGGLVPGMYFLRAALVSPSAPGGEAVQVLPFVVK